MSKVYVLKESQYSIDSTVYTWKLSAEKKVYDLLVKWKKNAKDEKEIHRATFYFKPSLSQIKIEVKAVSSIHYEENVSKDEPEEESKKK